jgi:REP element-mobilizing transposase RayT
MDARGASVQGQGQETDGMDRIQQGQGFGPQSKNLGSVIRGIKSAVTRFANENNIPFGWQSRYHDHIVRNQDEMNRIAEYIETNPIRWDNDCFYR